MEMSRNEVARGFLGEIFGPIPEDSCVEIRVKRNGESGVQRSFITDPQSLRVDGFPHDANVWFGVCLRRRGTTRGTGGDLTWASCVWADFDQVADKQGKIQQLRRCETPPSMIVDSGGGLHAYWKLNRLLDLRDETQATYIREVVYGLAHKLDGDRAVHDLARCMRLPGTYNPGNGNTKVYDPPREARVIH